MRPVNKALLCNRKNSFFVLVLKSIVATVLKRPLKSSFFVCPFNVKMWTS